MIVSSSALVASGSTAIDDTHDVGFLHDHQFLAIYLDLGPRPLAEEDAIAGWRASAKPAGSRPPRRGAEQSAAAGSAIPRLLSRAR